MTQHLPTPSSGTGNWGNIQNVLFKVGHNSDGTLKTSSLHKSRGVISITSNITKGNITLVAVSTDRIYRFAESA